MLDKQGKQIDLKFDDKEEHIWHVFGFACLNFWRNSSCSSRVFSGDEHPEGIEPVADAVPCIMTLKKLLARPRRATVAAVLTLALVGVYVMVSGPADLGRRRQTTSESSEEASTMQPIGSKDWEDDQDQTVPSYQDWYEEEAVVFGQLEDREIRVDHEMFYFVVDRDDLTKGQACVVESAAKLHPHRRIFVLFNREKVKDVLQSPTMSVLLTLGNVWFRYIDPDK